jgi:hypothetical protein
MRARLPCGCPRKGRPQGRNSSNQHTTSDEQPGLLGRRQDDAQQRKQARREQDQGNSPQQHSVTLGNQWPPKTADLGRYTGAFKRKNRCAHTAYYGGKGDETRGILCHLDYLAGILLEKTDHDNDLLAK